MGNSEGKKRLEIYHEKDTDGTAAGQFFEKNKRANIV